MRQIDVHKLADEARFNGFHGLVLFWCALIIVFDGYDLAVAGIALPSIMKGMGVDATSAGFMVSSALFGMMIGAIFFGTVADRIGRRTTIAICVALFSVFTAAAGFMTEPVSFSVTRFLAGLGIGGVMPNVVAQMTEYSPRRIRSTMVTLMFSGYAVGGMLAAVLGKGLIETYGWQSVFLAAGVPVLMVPFILKSMPESMPFLLKSGRIDELKRTVARLSPSYEPRTTDQFGLPAEDKADNAPIRHLFQDGRGFSTLMFWVAFFTCLFMVYALSSWLVKLMAGAGYSLGSALNFVLVLNFGAIVGAIGGGWLADRFHIKYVLMAFYALAGVSIALLGYKVPTERAVLPGRHGGGDHHRHADPGLRLCGPVLPDGGALHRHRLGLGHRAHGGDPGADRDWHAGGAEPALGAELLRHRDSGGDRAGGHRLRRPWALGVSASRRPERRTP